MQRHKTPPACDAFAMGFSLVELVVVLAVAALLAAQAMPAYRGIMLRLHRQEARNALLDVARAQEWHYLSNRGYALPGALTDPPPAGLGVPAFTDSGRYSLRLDSGSDATAFTAWAEAIGDQLADTRCTNFSIDSRGRLGALDAQGRPASDCWR